MTIVLAVLNQKGGVGKSTLSQNLAAVAHLSGRRTLLLDADEQATSFDWHCARVATSKLRGLSVQKADNPRLWTLGRFAELTAGFDVVVCDGPPRVAHVSQAAATCADVVLVPMRPGHAEWWAAARNATMLDNADAVRGQLGKGPVRRAYVLNEVFPRVRETEHVAAALREGEADLLEVTIGHRVAFDRARGLGEAVCTTEPDGAAARELHALFGALVARGEA